MNLPPLPSLAVNFLLSPLYILLGLMTYDPPPILPEDHVIPPKKTPPPRPKGEKK